MLQIVPYPSHSCMKVFFSKLGPPDYYAHGTPKSTAEERLADSVSLVPKKTEIYTDRDHKTLRELCPSIYSHKHHGGEVRRQFVACTQEGGNIIIIP